VLDRTERVRATPAAVPEGVDARGEGRDGGEVGADVLSRLAAGGFFAAALDMVCGDLDVQQAAGRDDLLRCGMQNGAGDHSIRV